MSAAEKLREQVVAKAELHLGTEWCHTDHTLIEMRSDDAFKWWAKVFCDELGITEEMVEGAESNRLRHYTYDGTRALRTLLEAARNE